MKRLEATDFVELDSRTFASFRKLVASEAAAAWPQAAAPPIAIGAMSEGQPATLALFDCLPPSKTARLRFFQVEEPFRRRGIERGLMAHAASVLRQRGCLTIVSEFMADGSAYPDKARQLEDCGFGRFEPGIFICDGPLSAAVDMRWYGLELPDGFTVDSWSRLTERERRSIELAGGGEYPEKLSPFEDEEAIDAERSLLLRYNGSPAGWMLVEQMDEKSIIFKTMYVYKKHQRLARGVALFATAVRHMIAEGVYAEGMFFVERENEPMWAFAGKHFDSPFLRKRTLWRSMMPI